MRARSFVVFFTLVQQAWCNERAAFAREEVELAYERGAGAETCLDGAAMQMLVAARLGYDPFVSAGSASVPKVTATIERNKGEYRAEVTFWDAHGLPRGTRRIVSASDDCEEITAAVATSLSILLDPKTMFRGAPVDTVQDDPFREVPVRPTPGSTPTSREVSRETLSAPRLALSARFGLSSVVSVGSSPSAAVGVGALAGVGGDAWSVDAEARADLPASTTAGGARARSSLLLVSLAPCWHYEWVVGCVVAAMGTLRGEGLVGDSPIHDSSLYASIGVRAGAEVRLGGPFRLRAYIEIGVPLTPTTLRVGSADVWSTSGIVGALGIGPQVSF